MYRLLKPFLFELEAERAHEMATGAGRLAAKTPLVAPLVRRFFTHRDPRLAVERNGIHFPNPLGLAAGFDKNGRNVDLAALLGFGFMEAGSVTPEPWTGNPQPRLFRLPQDSALINRMGFNNDGAEVVAQRLRRTHPFPVGVSVSKTPRPELIGPLAIEDYARAVRLVSPVADFIVVDVSCPNTADGMTFARDPRALHDLLSVVKEEAGALAVYAKLTVDLDDATMDGALAVVSALGLAGVVLSNTTVSRAGLRTPEVAVGGIGRGGLSGPPLFPRVLRAVARTYTRVGSKMTIIGCGGIDSPERAYEMLAAGASLIELYTGLVYQGPGLPKRICKGILAEMERAGIASLAEVVGSAAKRVAQAA